MRRGRIIGYAAFVAVVWLPLGASAAPTVVLTSNLTTVARFGNVTFTTTVTPSTHVVKVILSYSDGSTQSEDATYPYLVSRSFSKAMDNLKVAASVHYDDGTVDDHAELLINVVGIL